MRLIDQLNRISWRKLCAALVLPLVMVFVQHGAFLHELGHLPGQETQETQDAGDKHSAHIGICVQCVAFAQVSTGGSARFNSPGFLAHLVFEMLPRPTMAFIRADVLLARRGRGPPAST